MGTTSTPVRAIWAIITAAAVVLATMAPAVGAQDDSYTIKNRFRTATVSVDLLEIGGAGSGDLASRVNIEVSHSKLSGEYFSTVEILNWACGGVASDSSCERLANEYPESDLQVRIRNNKQRAVITGTYGDGIAVNLVLDAAGEWYTVRTTETTERADTFTKIRTKARVQPASFSGTVGAATFERTNDDGVEFRIERMRYTSNDPIDSIPEDH